MKGLSLRGQLQGNSDDHPPPAQLGISHLSNDMCLLSCPTLNQETVQEGTRQKEVGT